MQDLGHPGIDGDVLIPNATPSLKPFKVIDPYNNNEVEGLIHIEATQLYGGLDIEKVNGREAKQRIWCTPKMRYPFGGDEKKITTIPKHNTIQCYEKLDGTNIMAFIYHDADGKEYISYKTRLMPFLKMDAHKFGDFRAMWNEMLAKYPEIPDLVRKYRGVSFEMYGKRNQILMNHSIPLDIKLLFAVPSPGKILSPSGIETKTVPKATKIQESKVTSVKDFTELYWSTRDWLNANLHVTEMPAKSSEGEDIVRKVFEGMEGTVWYAVDENNHIIDGVPFKCKPDAIFDVCTQGTIPTHSIQITIRNALEQDEPLTYELIKRLLLEEFPEDRIFAKEVAIRKEIARVEEEQRLLEEIIPAYLENGFDINVDKGTCMRFFGKKYDKKLSTKIYGLLSRQYGIE